MDKEINRCTKCGAQVYKVIVCAYCDKEPKA
jgi:hypothetical protein